MPNRTRGGDRLFPYPRSVAVAAVIPVKSFALGKGRLASALDPVGRARLGRLLAGHVSATVTSAGLLPLVVTEDPEVAAWAESAGLATHPDPGRGLNQAARAGVEWALDSHDPWLVIHSDLPLLISTEIAALVGGLALGRPVIAPSADGGTSAIGWDREVGFSFGVGSFHHHLASLDDPVIVSRRGLLLDVDSPRDLKAAAATKDGRWLLEFVGADPATSTGPTTGRTVGRNLY